MKRGDIWWARMALPAGRRPVVLISRDDAYRVRQRVTIAELTTRVRGLVTEVWLRPSDGVPRASVINADNIVTISKSQLETKIVSLSAEKLAELDRALMFALDLDG
ncbi:MAG TPA: type II toxin-antitoxin system PemK/MazF family toxin [Kofleriaceae bacterium]|nr:type II toxin-antitoxin system PemK/MazF family toxin [Kofleriaceae bacterium]